VSLAGLPILSRDEEDDLVLGLLEREREAFEIFFRLFAGPLTRFARNWLPPQDAEEVVDDALLDAAARIEDYDPARAQGSGLAIWLLIRCRSRALDRLRRLRRQREATTGLNQHEAAESDAAGPLGSVAAPDDPQRQVEARAELQALWASLSEQERIVVALHHFAGLTYHEIATRLNVQLSTVHEYAKRARGKLRQQV
jgi:RNA polymerase sigma-70 factor (ECF subfamily)